ncbi:MAG TPA: BTAD domain-containing putative transcriptional regulator, partial [Trueperaceae bacterium]
MAVLHIQLLDGGRLSLDGEPVPGLHSARLQSLLAYLVLNMGQPVPRRRLAFSFWPDSSEAQAQTNLRRELHHLRRALPDAETFLASDAGSLQWRPDAPAHVDVVAFEAAVGRALQASQASETRAALHAFAEAVKLYHTDLLPDCYDDWIAPERERLRNLCVTALEGLTDALEEQRAYREAIPHARRLLQFDALNEAAYRKLMRLHALHGDRAAALLTYR